MKHITKFRPSNSRKNLWSSRLYKILLGVLISVSFFVILAQEPKEVSVEKKKVDKDVISELTATLTSDSISVELKWTPPIDEGDVIIARSNEVIDTMEKLGISDSLGKYRSDKTNIFNSHKDINLRPGEYYYAIVLVSQVKKKKVKLFPGVNYTITPVVVPAKSDNPTVVPEISEVKPETDSISNLKIRKVDNSIRLTWTPPLDAEKNSPKYTIYRSFDPMSNVGLMEKATKVGEVVHPDTTFLGDGLDITQSVYYGVSVTIEDKETIPLIDNKSFRKFYFVKGNKRDSGSEEIKVVEENKETIITSPLQISNLSGKTRKDGVLLSWAMPEGAVNNSTTYYIYESTVPIVTEATSMLSEKAKRIGTVVHPDTSFLHPNLDRTSPVFYGVTTKTGTGEENLLLKEGQSYIKIEPAKKKKKKKKEDNKPEEKTAPVVEEANPDFDTIMNQYYKKDKFREALVKFKSLADRVSDNSLRGKSLFFAALCHYHLGEHSPALKILLKEEVQMNYDKERVDFYVKRCLENRGSK